jgi:hypothetical protein
VGRCVAGLLLEDPTFAILPPFFPVRTPVVSHALSICFPDAPEHLSEVLEMVLASVVHHRAWLRSTCPSHAIFKTALFLEEGLADKLGQLVQCRLGTQSDRMRATGIPPHIQLNCRMLNVEKGLAVLPPAIKESEERIISKVINGVVLQIEARGMQVGTVTRDGMEQSISTQLQAHIGPMMELIRGLTANQAPPATQPATSLPSVGDGRTSHLPPGFVLPMCTLRSAWLIWCCGDPACSLPPLRQVEASDFEKGSDDRKRFSDLKFLMNAVRAAVPASPPPSSLEEANAMLSAAIPLLGFPEETEKTACKRRLTQYTWLTYVNDLRKMKRVRQDS